MAMKTSVMDALMSVEGKKKHKKHTHKFVHLYVR